MGRSARVCPGGGVEDPAGLPARVPGAGRWPWLNIGSWRVLENCGMRRARTFYYPDADLMPGAEHGDFVYELTRGDWCGQGKDEPSEHGESRVGRDAPGSPES